MPGDPLAPVTAGDPLPNRADTFNEVFAAARNFRAKKRAGQNAVTTTPERFSPAHVITVVNSTGGTLPIFSVVELTDTLESLTSDYLTISSRPAVEGISPTATTAPFAILLDGVANGGLVRAVVGGCAVVDVDITDSSHEYATPKVSTTANLTSAASGPVRILERESGSSGVKRACVLVTQPHPVLLTAKESDGSPSYAGITSIEFDQADGFTLSQPGEGRVKVNVSTGGLMTVKEFDGSPSYSSITSLEFDQSDGFTVSQPAAGRAKVEFSQVYLTTGNTSTPASGSTSDESTTELRVVAPMEIEGNGGIRTLTPGGETFDFSTVANAKYKPITTLGIVTTKASYTPPNGNDPISGSLGTDDVWATLGGSSSPPSGLYAGTYLFTATLIGKFLLDGATSPAGQFGAIIARFYNSTTSTVASVQFRVVIGKSLTEEMHGHGSMSAIITVAEGDDIKIQARRNTTPFGGAACVYTSASIVTQTGDDQAGQCNVCWHRLF